MSLQFLLFGSCGVRSSIVYGAVYVDSSRDSQVGQLPWSSLGEVVWDAGKALLSKTIGFCYGIGLFEDCTEEKWSVVTLEAG